MTTEFTPWKFPGRCGDHSYSGGTIQWYNYDGVKAKGDGNVAYNGPVNASMPAGALLHWLKTDQYEFELPAGAQVTKVHARIRARAPVGSVRFAKLVLTTPHSFNTFRTESQITTGVVIGNTFTEYLFEWPYAVLINDADLNLDAITNIVESIDFGVSTAVSAISNGSKVEVDSVEMRVEYEAEDTVEPPVDSDIKLLLGIHDQLEGVLADIEDYINDHKAS